MLCSLPWHTDFPRSSVQNLLRLAQADKVQYGLRLKRNRDKRRESLPQQWRKSWLECQYFFVWYEFWMRDFKQSKLVPVNGFLLLHGADFVSAISCRGLDKAIFFCRELAHGS